MNIARTVKHVIWVVLISIVLSSCNQVLEKEGSESMVDKDPTATITKISTLVADSTYQYGQTAEQVDDQLDEADWMNFPVIPEIVSNRTIEVFKAGQIKNNNPKAFSVIGDCDSSSSWFLGDFDKRKENFTLGEYSELKTVIDEFQGSYGRNSTAVRKGFNTASVLSPIWADQEMCDNGESPLNCEIRLHNPSFAFVLLGSNDKYNLEKFESNMREILDFLISKGIVPILATKADNNEGNNQINLTIAKLALEYDVPLWNYWRVVQSLPDHGLQQDGTHLTWGHNYFDDEKDMQQAWPWRNLTALQVLNKVWQSVNN